MAIGGQLSIVKVGRTSVEIVCNHKACAKSVGAEAQDVRSFWSDDRVEKKVFTQVPAMPGPYLSQAVLTSFKTVSVRTDLVVQVNDSPMP